MKITRAVEGWTAPGYGPVRELFALGVADGLEDQAQCTVYVRGELVVDVWTSAGSAVQSDACSRLQNVFSSSKVLTSLVVAILVDRGLLAYDQPVSSIWPEFAQCGKGGITIAQLMRHQAGLAQFSEAVAAEDLHPDEIRGGGGIVSQIIARQKPSHTETDPDKAPREYHGLTRGWILNEIVTRVDLQSRTIGEFLRDEVAVPLGLSEELGIGVQHLSLTQEQFLQRVQPLKGPRLWWTWWNLLMPRLFGGGKVPIHSISMRIFLALMLPLYKLVERAGLIKTVANVFALALSRKSFSFEPGLDRCKSDRPEPTADTRATLFRRRSAFEPELTTKSLWDQKKRNIGIANLFNTSQVRASECPSANGYASGRALAKIAALIVCGGKLPGASSVRIISERGLNEAHAKPVPGKMFGFVQFLFTQAGWSIFKKGFGGGLRDGFIGWMGLGGSVCQWHPELAIGFGYAMNQMEIAPTNERALRLQLEVVRCARRGLRQTECCADGGGTQMNCRL